jgi:hypothetical protein
MPPVATTPQSFCGSAFVSDLQATGNGIKWYLSEYGNDEAEPSSAITPDAIYYAAQTAGVCESAARTAVKVIITDNIVIDAPNITNPQAFCEPAEGILTIADIATNGNTNIVWYDAAINGNLLSSDSEIEHGKTYYAAINAGTCQSTSRAEVEIIFTTNSPSSPVIKTPQSFCEGALIANIAVPHNQIIWYSAATGGIQLPATYMLKNGVTYFAAHKAGNCESEVRTPVTINLTTPEVPVAPQEQAICGKLTLADLTITGAGIVWYDENGDELPLNTLLVAGKSYWAAQSSGNCESAKIKISISDACYVVYGTMFPFVNTQNPVHNKLFPVTVKLFAIPASNIEDPLSAILTGDPIQTTKAEFYDGSIHIPGTPRNPGVMGASNNPGLPIDWASLGRTVAAIDNTPVSGSETPIHPVGMYKFENIVPGSYILEISRPGFLTRWGIVTISEDGGSLGHREIIAGDVNHDFVVDMSDASNIILHNFDKDSQEGNYDPKYDLDGDGEIDGHELQIIQQNIPATIGIYEETQQWLNP